MNRIISMIVDSIKGFKDKTAVVETGRGDSLTYGQLDVLARRIAARLIRGGVRPGSCVTVELPRSAVYPAATLGAWFCPRTSRHRE